MISFNNAISIPFKLDRDVRQGDPLSPLLYVTAFEPFLKRINTTLKGIRIKNLYIKTRAFANNIVIAMINENWSKLNKITNDFELYSGAKINSDKSKLLILDNKSTLQNYYRYYTISKKVSLINFLGFDIFNNKFNY